MNKELIMQADVLDIIFENRNKAYGAYDLRKYYEKRMQRSLLFMFSIVVVFSAFTFLPGKKAVNPEKELVTIMGHILPDQKEPEKKKETPKEPVQQQAGNKKPTGSNIVIVPNNVPTDTIQNIEPTDVVAPVIVDPGPGPGGPLVDPVEPPVMPVEPLKPPVDINTPRNTADVMPEFPGGMDALSRFFQRHLVNPRDMEEGESVSVQVKFVVGYDGKLKNFVTIKDGGPEFNKEVVRVLKKMPEWIPGKSKGENVSVYYTIPVKFVPGE